MASEDVLERADMLIWRLRDDEYFGSAEVVEALAAAQSRIAELERMVVWCAKHGIWYGRNMMRGYLLHSIEMDDDGDLYGDDRIDCDGTPASILAAVEKAMGERCEN